MRQERRFQTLASRGSKRKSEEPLLFILINLLANRPVILPVAEKNCIPTLCEETAQTSLEIMTSPTKQQGTCMTPLTSLDMNVSRSIPSMKMPSRLYLKPCIPLKAVQGQGVGFITESKIFGTPARPARTELLLPPSFKLDEPRKKAPLPPRLQPCHLLEFIQRVEPLLDTPRAEPLLDSPRAEASHPEEPPPPARSSNSSRIIPFEACKSGPSLPALPDTVPQHEINLSCRSSRRRSSSSCQNDWMLPPQKRVAYDKMAA